MTDRLLNLIILTPESLVYQDKVSGVVVPAYQGYLGVLYNHAPLICQLKIGRLKIKTSVGKEKFFAIAGGLMKVKDNGIIILTSACEPAESCSTALNRV